MDVRESCFTLLSGYENAYADVSSLFLRVIQDELEVLFAFVEIIGCVLFTV